MVLQQYKILIVIFVFFSFLSPLSYGSLESESLLKFKSSLTNISSLITWNNENLPCTGNHANWKGVICFNDSVRGLQLENMGLSGKIDVEALERLPNLRSISFINNFFDGELPDFKKDASLRAIYLSRNNFSGMIPDDAFVGMNKLRKVFLSRNQFIGPIPSSLTKLPKLTVLRLDSNNFSGKIPTFIQHLHTFNVSENTLEGSIPITLRNFNASSFTGNNALCDKPLKQCNPIPETKSYSIYNGKDLHSRSSLASLVVIIMVSVVAFIGIVGAFIILCHRKHSQMSLPISMGSPTPSNFEIKAGIIESHTRGSTSPNHLENGKKLEIQKLSFVNDDREKFDLSDLLKASAEILGSGCFGSSYKANITSGKPMVVKRFKQMNNVGREEFQEHMRRLGRLSHQNLLPLVAYYYRKEEKLLVSDFISNGSLAVHLHGHQSVGKPSLNWQKRIKIIKGIARGLTYLYKELPCIISPHGHLKSSNVLINDTFEPILTDYGLVPVINNEEAQELMVAYKSPEFLQHGRITKKTDVWNLGILMLEIISGRFPSNFLQQGKGSDVEDLAKWVISIPHDQWITLVLDKEMGASNECNGEIVKLLEIAIQCCEPDVDKRPELKEVVEKLNEIKEKEEEKFLSS